jgi:hypothetical protein
MVLAALSTILCLVAPPQSAPAQAPVGTGVIAGRLTSADQGRPVRKAQVKLVALSPKQTRNTVTDAAGGFAFTNLPAGEYTLSASKPGYLDSVFGALRPGLTMPGVVLQLGVGQKLDDVVFRIPRGGAIGGIVTDEFGDPAFNVPVRAARFNYENGRRVPRPAGNATTDDLGVYRIAGLMPGEYVVSATPRDSVAAAAAAAESLRQYQAKMLAERKSDGTDRAAAASFERARRELGRDPTAPPDPFGYVAVYHPSSTTPAGAARIRVGVGEQLGAIDIQLQAMKTGTVTGSVTAPDGTPGAGRVQLLDPTMPLPNLVMFGGVGADGRFAFHGVSPGAYVVLTQAPAEKPGTELTAAAEIQVTEGGVHDVPLVLRAGVSASGSVDVSSVSGVDLRRVQLDFMRIPTAADWEYPVPSASPDAEGRFAVYGLAPGLHRISARGLPEGWVLESAMYDGLDAADHHLRVETRPVSGIVVKFAKSSAQVSGAVTNSSGAPVSDHAVIVFPAEAALWVPRSRRIHLAQPDAQGRYTFKGLPAGEYRMAVVIPPEAGQENDLEFLAQAAQGALTLTLGPSEQKTQDLRVR